MMKVTLSDILKIIGMITAVVVVGGGFYLTVHDNTNGLKDIKTEVAALASKTQTDIDGVDDDIDEAVNDLSAIVTETFRVFEDALWEVETEVDETGVTMIGVGRDISELQGDYEDLNEKFDQQLTLQMQILDAVTNN